MTMTTATPDIDPDSLNRVRDLYERSFPAEERRPWDDLARRITAPENIMRLHVIRSHSGNFAGFMTLWHLTSAIYVEHFAIADDMRGHGIGSQALGQLKAIADGRTVVLEAELPDQSPEATRRIRFYTRAGFTAHPGFPYTQPPYSQGLPAVPMILLTLNFNGNPHRIASEIHATVYATE